MRASRSAARTWPTPCSPIPPTRSASPTRASTARTSCSRAYLVPGAQAYVARTRPTVPDAIRVIHAAGGVAVWAHPFWDLDDPQEGIARSTSSPTRGSTASSASTPPTPRSRRALLHGHAEKRGLLRTGSSDFHGPEHDRFSTFLAFELYGLEPELGPIARSSAV